MTYFKYWEVYGAINMQGTTGSTLLRLCRASELISLKTFTRGKRRQLMTQKLEYYVN